MFSFYSVYNIKTIPLSAVRQKGPCAYESPSPLSCEMMAWIQKESCLDKCIHLDWNLTPAPPYQCVAGLNLP